MKRIEWSKLLIGVVAVFALFQWVASVLGSVRGEAGILVGLIVVIATVKVERFLFTEPVSKAALAVGLGRPRMSGVVVAVVIAAIMLGSAVVFAMATGSGIGLYPNWQWLAIGIFCQAGIAEETLFRGFLFGHMRQRHTFWKAAGFAAIPFLLVHLILFFQFSWSLAGASILLSIAISFPLSKLYEMNGDTIWAPAIVHFATQAMAKLIVPTGENAWLFPFFVIAASAVLPLLVYAVPLVEKLRGRRAILSQAGAAALVLMLAVVISRAQSRSESNDEFWSRTELTGDWNGMRDELREKAVDLKFRMTQGYQFVAWGGRERGGTYTGKFDTRLIFDMEKLVGWKRFSIQVKTETRFGREPEAGTGLPINSAALTPASVGTAFAVTALNFTQLLPLNEEQKDFIAVGAGKYYSLDSSREPFTGGAGVTRFMGIASNGNPAAGQTVPTVTNGATFAWVRKGSPFITLAVFDPAGSPRKAGLKELFRQGVTLVPGISVPTKFARLSGRHSLSGTVTTRKLTPFDQLAQFVVPGSPATPAVPRSGSWSATYTFHQYIRERMNEGQKSGWGIFGTFAAADRGTSPVSGFVNFGIGGTALFESVASMHSVSHTGKLPSVRFWSPPLSL